MRIGVVTTSYPRSTGDFAGSFVAGLSRYLYKRGHRVEVIAAGAPREGDADAAIPVARVPAGAEIFYDQGAPERLERSWTARLRAPIFTAALTARAQVASRAWDAVVSHWLAPSALAAAATRKPHLAIAHSGDVHLLARRGLADVCVGALLAGGPLAVAFAGAHLEERLLASCTPPTRRALETRSFVCPMGIDVAAFAALRPSEAEPLRGRPFIAFVGRLVPIKGVDVLIEAAEKLGRPAQLVIGGAGPERRTLEALAKEACARVPGLSIRFAGEVQGETRDALYAAADVLVVPSLDLPTGRTEGTPTVVLEALATGVPLVASDVGGVRSVSGDAATLVPPGDPDALAAALRALFDEPEATAARVRAGREQVKRYDWEVIGARLEDALVGLVAK